jgi:hypothetical protein
MTYISGFFGCLPLHGVGLQFEFVGQFMPTVVMEINSSKRDSNQISSSAPHSHRLSVVALWRFLAFKASNVS